MKYYLEYDDSNLVARLKGLYVIPILVLLFTFIRVCVYFGVKSKKFSKEEIPTFNDLKDNIFKIWFWNY